MTKDRVLERTGVPITLDNMMENSKISTVMGLWSVGFFTDEEIRAWANQQILGDNEECWGYLELYRDGPLKCVKKPSEDFPAPREFSFQEQFLIRLSKVDLENDKEIENFIAWTAYNSMGNDIDVPVIRFGYQLDHYLDYNERDPLVYFKEEIHRFSGSSQSFVHSLLLEINADYYFNQL